MLGAEYMTEFAKIVDHPNLVRDLNTRAILNLDTVSVRRHEKRIQDLQKEQARDQELSNLKQEVSEIHALLAQLSNTMIKLAAK
jgi:hypothetical protein